MAARPGSAASEPIDLYHEVLELCEPYVTGVFDLSVRGGSDRTVVVTARSAAHVRRLATRLGDAVGADPEGEAPDGTDPWIVVDGGFVVVHLLTEASLARFGLVELFSGTSHSVDVFAVVAEQRLRELRERRVG
ncbi:RsfS/YbeB/iojap family protein [bacterium]|nr:RsfS/YbeB/iojap family protein [bacterium]